MQQTPSFSNIFADAYRCNVHQRCSFLTGLVEYVTRCITTASSAKTSLYPLLFQLITLFATFTQISAMYPLICVENLPKRDDSHPGYFIPKSTIALPVC